MYAIGMAYSTSVLQLCQAGWWHITAEKQMHGKSHCACHMPLILQQFFTFGFTISVCISATCKVYKKLWSLSSQNGAILLNPHNWEQNYATWLHKANVWIECAPVYINFFLNYIKIFLPFLCRLCVVYISALCMHRLTSTTGLLKSCYHLLKIPAGIEYFRPPKACFHHRHWMHFFAIVSVVHLSITLADQPPALWSVLSSSENQLVSFTCKLEAKFMWVQLSGLEIIWSRNLKNT